MKTAAWMQATAISRINKMNSKRKDKMPSGDAEIDVHTTQEHKKIRRWPASILAPSRKPNVKG